MTNVTALSAKTSFRILVCIGVLSAVCFCAAIALGRSDPTEPLDARSLAADRQANSNEAMFDMHGVIEGAVHFADGRPAVGFRVEARFSRHRSATPGEGFAITDADGKYTIRGLTSDTFAVAVANEGKPFITRAAEKVVVASRNAHVAGVDLVLDNGPVITVDVRDSTTGKPIAGIPIETNRQEWYTPELAGTTDLNGQFVYRSPCLNNVLMVRSSAEYPFGSSYMKMMRPGESAHWDVMMYPPNAVPVVLSGDVTTENGRPLANATVDLFRDQYCAKRAQETTTDDRGRFSFQTESMGSAANENGAALTIRSGIGDHPGTLCRFVHTADFWKPLNICFEPENAAAITGVALSPDGVPLAGVPIRLETRYWNPAINTAESVETMPSAQENRGVTDAHGHFTLGNLYPEAVYHITLGGQPQYGQGVNTYALTDLPRYAQNRRSLLGDIRLHPGETRDVGSVHVWRAESMIAGRIIDYSGKLAEGNVMVTVRGAHTNAAAYPDPDGFFRISSVVQEPLILLVVYGTSIVATSHAFAYSDIMDGCPESDSVAYRGPVTAGDMQIMVDVPVKSPREFAVAKY